MCLRAGIKEFDVEPAIPDGTLLPDQLVQPLCVDVAVSLSINIETVVR